VCFLSKIFEFMMVACFTRSVISIMTIRFA